MAKRYDKEFKLHVVKQVIKEGKSIAQVSRELDLANQTVHRWVQKYHEDQVEPFIGSGNLRSEDRSIKELDKKLRDLEKRALFLKCVAKVCKVLGVSKSGYYNWFKRPTSNQKS